MRAPEQERELFLDGRKAQLNSVLELASQQQRAAEGWEGSGNDSSLEKCGVKWGKAVAGEVGRGQAEWEERHGAGGLVSAQARRQPGTG